MSASDEFRPASVDGYCSHAVWGLMCDEIDRLRAELTVANNRLGNAVGALIDAGGPLLIADDGRGYRLTFRAGHYEAGCRRFSHAEAVDHWSNPEHDAPKSAALLLAAVEAHHGATS